MHLVFDIDKRRGDMKHRDRGRRRIGLDAPADLEAVDVGQLDIEDDQVGQGGDQPQGLAARGGLLDLETRPDERLGDRVALGGIVVDEQDEGLGSLGIVSTPPYPSHRRKIPAFISESRTSAIASSRDSFPLARIAAVSAISRPRSFSSRIFEVLMITGISLVSASDFKPVEDLEAGHVGEDQVEEDDIGLHGASVSQGFLALVRLDDLEMAESRQGSL